MPIQISTPDALKGPGAYYSVMTRVPAGSDLIHICGICGYDGEWDHTPGIDDFTRQCNQVYRTIGKTLEHAGAGYGNIVQFTTYLASRDHIAPFVEWRKREFPKMFPNKVYPPNTLIIAESLMDTKWSIEVSTVAAV